MNNEEIDDCLAQLEGDLDALGRLSIRNSPVLLADIRSMSNILRKWIVHNLLFKLCRATELTPTVPYLHNDEVLEHISNGANIEYFQTGGVRMNGTPFIGMYAVPDDFDGTPEIPVDRMKMELGTLGKFAKQKRIYYAGTFFTCEEIIKFVANKLGGSHYDSKLDEHQAALEEASRYFLWGGPPIEDWKGKKDPSMYIVAEPLSKEVLSGVHIEIIAAAASLFQLHLNGEPIFQIERTVSFRQRVMKLLRRRPTPIGIIDYRDLADDER